jgi:hypothetical protein
MLLLAAGVASPPAALAQSPRLPAQVTIVNGRAVPLTKLEIATTGDRPRLVAKLARPLAPGKSVALRLNRPSGCSFYVLGRFSDEVENDHDGVDLCKDTTLRLTD